MARRMTVDRIEVLPELFPVRWYRELKNSVSVDGWAWISVVCFVVFLVMLVLFLFSGFAVLKKIGFFIGAAAFMLTLWTFCIARNRWYSEQYEVQAIVVAPSVPVKGSPDNSGTDLFLVHEGLKVDVVSTLGEWCNIRLQDGNEGWISASDIEKI